jgi:cytochrome c-type biogenesis protein CcmH/NrfF
VLRAIILFVLLLPLTSNNVLSAEDMTSDLICPCECAMVISTCDCPTALQVKKEISSMKKAAFSDEQIFSALQAEYGKEILVHQKNSIPLWMGGISLALLFVFLGYIFTKKPNLGIIPDKKKYERQFEEEYRKFVSELEEEK